MTALSPPFLTLEAFGAVSVFKSSEALRLRPLVAEAVVLVVAGFLALVEMLAVPEDGWVEGPASVGSEVLKPFLIALNWPLWEERVLVGWRDGWNFW